MPNLTKDWSVRLDGSFNMLLGKVKKLEAEVLNLRQELTAVHDLYGVLKPLTTFLRPNDALDAPESLLNAGKFIESITNELHTRMKRANNVILFNVSDKITLEKLKFSFLSPFGIPSSCASFVRLRKASLKQSPAILVKLTDKALVEHILRHQKVLASHSAFQNVVVKPDLSPLQRLCRRQRKPSITTHSAPSSPIPSYLTTASALVPAPGNTPTPSTPTITSKALLVDDSHTSTPQPACDVTTNTCYPKKSLVTKPRAASAHKPFLPKLKSNSGILSPRPPTVGDPDMQMTVYPVTGMTPTQTISSLTHLYLPPDTYHSCLRSTTPTL